MFDYMFAFLQYLFSILYKTRVQSPPANCIYEVHNFLQLGYLAAGLDVSKTTFTHTTYILGMCTISRLVI